MPLEVVRQHGHQLLVSLEEHDVDDPRVVRAVPAPLVRQLRPELSRRGHLLQEELAHGPWHLAAHLRTRREKKGNARGQRWGPVSRGSREGGRAGGLGLENNPTRAGRVGGEGFVRWGDGGAIGAGVGHSRRGKTASIAPWPPSGPRKTRERPRVCSGGRSWRA